MTEHTVKYTTPEGEEFYHLKLELDRKLKRIVCRLTKSLALARRLGTRAETQQFMMNFFKGVEAGEIIFENGMPVPLGIKNMYQIVPITED